MVILRRIEQDTIRYLFIHQEDSPEHPRRQVLEIAINDDGLKLVRPWGELYISVHSLKNGGFVGISSQVATEELKEFLLEILENL